MADAAFIVIIMGSLIGLAIASLVISVLGTVAGVGTSIAQNRANKVMTEDTNETNLQIAQDANAAQAAESEKAYERSKASNQVALMQQAGMSRAGAINALNGGGSYTPAAINTAQMQAPQADYSGIQQALGGLNGAMSNTTQAAAMQKQLDMQSEEAQANINYTNAQTRALQQQQARDMYDQGMKQLSDEMKVKATDIMQRVKPSAYKTQSDYISALKLKCSPNELDYFKQPAFVDVLNGYYGQNSQAVTANIQNENTKTNTEHTKEDTKRLKESIKILKNDVYVSDMTHMSEADRINAENALRNIIADSGYELETLKYDYLISDEGKERQEKIESAKKFWELAETRYGIPARVLIQVAKMIGAVYVGKGLGGSSSGQVVRQGAYQYIYSN